MLFGKKESRDPVLSPQPVENDEELSSVAQSLYKQNMELAVKNKTLSILGKLYEISIQTLTPEELATHISETIQKDFEFERVGILFYDTDTDTSELLASSESERFHTARAVASDFFENIELKNVSHNPFFGPIFTNRKMGYTENLLEAWGEGVKPEQAEEIRTKANVKSILAYPLINQNAVIGFFVITLNRKYADLGEYEKESIHSFSNVISVALDKARLYQELKVTNEKLEEANDRLKQVDQLKSEFLSVASHQLRAPITAIKGYIANVLEDSYGVVPEYLKEPLGVVQESTRVMTSSIEDYLDVSRIEQGRMKYEFGPVDVSKLVRTATEELKPLAAKKGITLSFTEAPEITVEADFGKTKQIFTNLIDNAIKYTEQGSVTVSIEKDEAKGVVRFMTSDTGIGIPADEINKLFEKFTRARDANKVNTTGTGLGLYVAKSLVEGQNGTIHIESDGVGKGSRFIVELPLVQPAQAAA
jgi:signal transduction histidine kinase